MATQHHKGTDFPRDEPNAQRLEAHLSAFCRRVHALTVLFGVALAGERGFSAGDTLLAPAISATVGVTRFKSTGSMPRPCLRHGSAPTARPSSSVINCHPPSRLRMYGRLEQRVAAIPICSAFRMPYCEAVVFSD